MLGKMHAKKKKKILEVKKRNKRRLVGFPKHKRLAII